MAAPEPATSVRRPALLLFLLSCAAFLNSYDRSIFPIILEPMKHDLHLTDTQIGLLVGPAFALLFALVSLPAAGFADRGRRGTVLAWAMAFWSLMTALCGLATGFFTMALARFGVGAGEGAGAPSINGIAADMFDRKLLATILSVIVTASNIGTASALLIGGLLTDALGWRAAFLAGGVGGLVVALSIGAIFPRSAPATAKRKDQSALSLLSRLRLLFGRPSFALLCVGIGFSAIGMSALTAWAPTFFIRKFHVTPGEVGRTYGLLHGTLAIVVPLFVGALADRLARRDARWLAFLLVIIFLLCIPATLALLASTSFLFALMLMAPVSVLQLAIIPPYYALVQSLAGPALRSTAAAVSAAIIYLMGYGVGPPLVGRLSDLFARASGSQSLELAMQLSVASYLGGALMFALCARHVERDQRAAALSPGAAAPGT